MSRTTNNRLPTVALGYFFMAIFFAFTGLHINAYAAFVAENAITHAENNPEFSLSSAELEDGQDKDKWKRLFANPEEEAIYFKRFLKRLQFLLAHERKNEVTSLVFFPLTNPPVPGKAHFLDEYDKIFNSDLKNALKDVSYRDLFVNWRGVLVGDNNCNLWVNKINDNFKIISINYKCE